MRYLIVAQNFKDLVCQHSGCDKISTHGMREKGNAFFLYRGCEEHCIDAACFYREMDVIA